MRVVHNFKLLLLILENNKRSPEQKLMAYNKLGYSYMMGLGVKRNMLKAIFYYEYAADFFDDILAHIILGDIYNHGDESIRDVKLAMYYYRLAANHGVAEAQYKIGLLFEQDDDIIRAQQYYKLAAAQNYEAAQHALEQYVEHSPEKILVTYSFIACSDTQSIDL